MKHPSISPLLANKPICLSVAGSLGVHLTLVSLDLPSWSCPIRQSLNIPCPGCGLSRAIALLLKGDWQQSLKVHLFAPVAVLIMGLIVINVILPLSWNRSLVRSCSQLEAKIPFVSWLLITAIAYWLIRLLIFPKVLYKLVM
ncbi:DUF2752 domain-containing protein [Gloeocapsa sp. PCC 73106]|uniref:DUF2752 domain-containing protein n=1 Tax=Gloeocapsa sp. PCC 73106 TaxID=102232 RepID=UPI0002AC0A43|nr:DUF2752 domain-containing protein [Gloeocapsa sp. PCC 73106]ELR96834.1 Protein of unknown function (DUF2752) [Gloeocapsa sp. PCC 73106]